MFTLIRRNLNYAYESFCGPFRKIDSIIVNFKLRSYLPLFRRETGTTTRTIVEKIPLAKLGNSVEFIPFGASDNLLKVKRVNTNILLSVPKECTLKQRTGLWGWTTVWDGLTPAIDRHPSQSTIDIYIPPRGWWQLSTHSTTTDILFELKSKYSVSPISATIDIIKDPTFTPIILTLVIYAVCTTFTINYAKINSLIKDPSEVADTFREVEEVAEKQKIEVIAEKELDVPKEDDAFQGASIVAILNRTKIKEEEKLAEQKVEEKKEEVKKVEFKPQDLSKKIKNLSKRLSSNMLAQMKSVKLPSSKSDATSMVSLSALRKDLLKKNESAPKITREPAAPPRSAQVNFKPQFKTDAKGKSNLPSDSQQKALLEIFSNSQDKFRGCYETALLKYEDLAATVTFEGEIMSDGKISAPKFNVNGRTTPESKETLVNCLKGVVQKMIFDKKMSGVVVKNQFIFKS
ncbi:MAG: hypothetical protein HQK53_14245 [Oligoflexia bacterium]|nr:hypothetical protein [Oligoflexia bacterium]